MLPRERFEAAFERRPVDRPPIMYQHLGAARTVLNAAGLTMREGYHDPEKFAKICIMAQRITGFDNVMAGWGDLLVDARAHGSKWKWPERDFYPRSDGYAISSLAELDRIQPVDPMKDEFWSVPLRAGGLLQERHGNEVAVAGFVNGPMILGGEIMGYENLLMSTWSEPDLVEDLLDRLLESSLIYGEHLSRMGIGFVFLEDATCSPDVTNPEGLERFDLSYISRLMSSFRSKGVRTIVHNCSANPFYEGYLKIDLDALHIVPRSEDRKGIYDKLRSRMTVVGGIDQMFLLFKGTPAEVDAEVRAIMDDWGDGPGFMIAPGCEMAFKTPIENIIALREGTAKWARGSLGDG